MRVLFCGDRNCTDRAAIARDALTLPKRSTVIHGNARGADRSAGAIAHAHGLEDRGAELRAARHGHDQPVADDPAAPAPRRGAARQGVAKRP